ncbi:MAG TPA: hypothetical protein VL992_11280 [Tepidisphaeraceae bacterium]|nr:hypothetical protein [Tepidisphaeraceae bacterium]
MNRARMVSLLGGLVLCGVGTSCIARDPASITSQDPDCLIPAIKEGVIAKDRKIIPYLVDNLQSDDSAVRFYSIDGLERLTGHDFGYVFYADEDQRKEAYLRWKKWLAQQ